MCSAVKGARGSLAVYLIVNIRGLRMTKGDLMNLSPMMVYQQKKMLVATVIIPKPIATMMVLCSTASRVRFSNVSHTSASAVRITTNMMRCMMMPPLSVEYSTSYPKDDDDLWGTRVRCTPSPMGGGVICFCGVVCVVLRLYLKRKNAQTLQYKIYSNLFILRLYLK